MQALLPWALPVEEVEEGKGRMGFEGKPEIVVWSIVP